MSYLFGFGGRINRAKMWLFILVTLAWEIAIALVAAFGLHWSRHVEFAREFVRGTSHTNVGAAFSVPDPINGPVQMAAVGIVALLAVLYVVSLLAVYTKRLHDRNKSAWWLIPFLVIPCGVSALKYTAVPGLVAMSAKFVPLGVGWDVAELVGAILGIWAFIELFFFRGTHGENRYGPDPLA